MDDTDDGVCCKACDGTYRMCECDFLLPSPHSFASADPFILSLGVLDVRTIGLGSFDSFETTSLIHIPHTIQNGE